MSWLEEAAKDGHEPEMKPQEIPNEKITTDTDSISTADRDELDT